LHTYQTHTREDGKLLFLHVANAEPQAIGWATLIQGKAVAVPEGEWTSAERKFVLELRKVAEHIHGQKPTVLVRALQQGYQRVQTLVSWLLSLAGWEADGPAWQALTALSETA
jgi:hypothetical protein